MEGLLLSGLAMQVVKSDLPSSGAEHQLTGIWEMERAVSGKDKIAHGKLLSIALLSVTAVYNKLLAFPFDEALDGLFSFTDFAYFMRYALPRLMVIL